MNQNILSIIAIFSIIVCQAAAKDASQSQIDADQESIKKQAEDQKDKIEGAFGLKLGDLFEPAKASGPIKFNGGLRYTPTGLVYQFVPKNPHPTFDQYFVSITPVSHKICAIIAQSKKLNSNKECWECESSILKLLAQKYGEPRSNQTLIQKGDKAISVETLNTSRVVLVCYRDTNTLRIGVEEESQIKLKSEKEMSDVEEKRLKKDLEKQVNKGL